MAPIKVLLCKEDAENRECFNSLLKFFNGFDFVGVTYNDEDILSEIIDLKPEVIIIDIELPGISGINVPGK